MISPPSSRASTRHHILLGTTEEGVDVKLPPYGQNVLLVGTSGSGKSTLATGLPRAARGAEVHVLHHRSRRGLRRVRGRRRASGRRLARPRVEEIVQVLAKPDASCIVNLVGLPIADRPGFFASLAPRLQELRARLGRPHWLVIDEAHHLLPAEWEPGPLALPEKLSGVLADQRASRPHRAEGAVRREDAHRRGQESGAGVPRAGARLPVRGARGCRGPARARAGAAVES